MLKKTFLFFFVLLLAGCSEKKPNSSQEYDSIGKIVPQLSQLTNSGQNFSFLGSGENKNSKYGFFKGNSGIYFYDVYETNPSDVFVGEIGKKSRDSKEYVDVDEASFEIVNGNYDRENIFGMNYSKDKNFVYWRDFVLSQGSGADPQTFEIIGSCYAKDKNYVYNGQNIVEGADPFSFKQLAHLSGFSQGPVCFGADEDKIFAEGFVHFSGIQFDYDSLEFINYGRGSFKDKNALYFRGGTCESNIGCEYGIFTGFDMVSLENVKYNLWKDKNNWYQIPNDKFIKLTVKFPNPQNTRYIGSFFVDNEFVYDFVFQDTTGVFVQATGIDAKTLTGLDYLYVKDSQNIFFDGKVVEGADIGSFHKVQNPQEKNLLQKGLTHCNPYHKDKSSVYQDGKIIGLDSSSFEIIPCLNSYICQCGRTKDKNGIYDQNHEKQEGLDIGTFEFVQKGWTQGYAKDKNNIYMIDFVTNDSNGMILQTKILSGANPETRQFYPEISGITHRYSHDDENVYWLDKIIYGANARRFQVLSEYYAKDKNNVFSRWKYKNKEGIEEDSRDYRILTGADVKTFHSLPNITPTDYYHAEDKNNRYRDGIATKKITETELFAVDKGQGEFADERLYKNKKSLKIIFDNGLDSEGDIIDINADFNSIIDGVNSKGLQGTPYRFTLSNKEQQLYDLFSGNSLLISGLQNIEGFSTTYSDGKDILFFQATQVGYFSGDRSAINGYWYKDKFHQFENELFDQAFLFGNYLYTITIGNGEDDDNNVQEQIFTLSKNLAKIYSFNSIIGTSSPIKSFFMVGTGRGLSYQQLKSYEGGNFSGSGDRVIINGIDIAKQNGRDEAFNPRWVNGKLFVLYKKNNKIFPRFDGNNLTNTGYDLVAHDLCCEPAMLNIENYENGLLFLAQKDGKWIRGVINLQ